VRKLTFHHLDSNCQKLLLLLASHGGKSNLQKISEDWQQDVPLTIPHWHSTALEEPQWRYEIRQAFYTLKDCGLVTGREHGAWYLRADYGGHFVSEQHMNQRSKQIFMRIMRDSDIVRQLKTLYKNHCQVCGTTINLANRLYSEAHHIRPLGIPHNGPDTKENMIILCPNHHVYFDYFAMAINPKTRIVEIISECGTKKEECGL